MNRRLRKFPKTCSRQEPLRAAHGDRCRMLGGNLTIGAQVRGGAIIEGPARDIDESRQLAFPVFARSLTGRIARGRMVEVSTGEPIRVGDVTVTPGDYVIADARSVVFIAQADIARVVEAAELIVQRESLM